MSEKKTNYIRLRIYDDDVLSYVDELDKTGLFKSKNDVINQALRLGIPALYKDVFGKKLSGFTEQPHIRALESGMQVEKELRKINLTLDNIFVEVNLLEYLTATLYNIELTKIGGINITDAEVRSGVLSDLPDQLQQVKDELGTRISTRRKS